MTDYKDFLFINITLREVQYFSKRVPVHFFHTQQ